MLQTKHNPANKYEIGVDEGSWTTFWSFIYSPGDTLKNSIII